jgi:2-oxoglutarate dehydrogenase E1 component
MTHGTVAAAPNLEAIDAAYQRWLRDPDSVDPSWRFFFEGFELGLARPAAGDGSETAIVRLIFAYRDLGHFLAHLDPLSEVRARHPLLELSEFGLTEADLDRVVRTAPFLGLPGKDTAPLRELLKALRETYCRTIGVEYMYIQDTRIRQWLQERMEPRRNQPRFDTAKKVRILKSLHYAELFERFLHTRYVGQKRFSLEGAETLIPVLEAVVESAPDLCWPTSCASLTRRSSPSSRTATSPRRSTATATSSTTSASPPTG